MEDFTEEAPDATLAGVMTSVMMLISFLFREEAVLKLRTNLRMHLRRFMGLGFTSKQFMEEVSMQGMRVPGNYKWKSCSTPACNT